MDTRVRNDNSSVATHAHSINSVTTDRRLNILLECRRGELYLNIWLSSKHIHAEISIADELTKAMSQTKSIK